MIFIHTVCCNKCLFKNKKKYAKSLVIFIHPIYNGGSKNVQTLNVLTFTSDNEEILNSAFHFCWGLWKMYKILNVVQHRITEPIHTI